MIWSKFLLLASVLANLGLDVHADSETWPDCECIVGPLNCDDISTVEEAVSYLRNHDCSEHCMSTDVEQENDHDHDHDHDEKDFKAECAMRFMVLDMYHAGCIAGDLPAAVGTAFHEYEEECYRCFHPSVIVPGEPDCPIDVCANGTAVQEANARLNDGSRCPGSPIKEECKSDFRVLLTYHDFCPESEDRITLINFHALEEIYEGIHCNYNSTRERDCNSSLNVRYKDLMDSNSASLQSVWSSVWAMTSLFFGIWLAC